MIDRHLTTPQVAKRLHVSLKTVQRMAADGRLHPIDKLPGRNGPYLFDEHEIDELAATGPIWPKYSQERERAS